MIKIHQHDVIVNIFDIDGCIIKDVFSNKELTTEDIEKTRVMLDKIKPYNTFLDYFKKVCIKENVINNIFITGRKEKDYGEITRKQLKLLNHTYGISFYPNNLRHIPEQYFQWKIDIIKETSKFMVKINKTFDDFYKEKTKVIINIYDDLNQYFEKLEDGQQKDCKYNFYHIKNKNNWKKLLKEKG